MFTPNQEETVVYNSFAGNDIKAFISVPIEEDGKPATKNKLLGDIQTISISSHRELGPVRRLGETAIKDYSLGTRTIAGSLIFAVLDQDVFAGFIKTRGAQNSADRDRYDLPLYADKLQPFNIAITCSNEFGAVAQMGVIGVQIVNFGMTMSIDDLLTEATYSYVAKYLRPLEKGSLNFVSAQEVISPTNSDIHTNYMRTYER